MNKRYDITCPSCNHRMQATRSIAQHMGMLDFGRGKCLDCGLVMKLVYNPNTDTMTAYDFEEINKQGGH